MDHSVEREADGRLLVKIATDEWEINVRASADDLSSLANVRSADWDARRSLRVGESAGAPVFWGSADDRVTLMIGNDDETWDVLVALPVGVVDAIVHEAEIANR